MVGKVDILVWSGDVASLSLVPLEPQHVKHMVSVLVNILIKFLLGILLLLLQLLTGFLDLVVCQLSNLRFFSDFDSHQLFFLEFDLFLTLFHNLIIFLLGIFSDLIGIEFAVSLVFLVSAVDHLVHFSKSFVFLDFEVVLDVFELFVKVERGGQSCKMVLIVS